MALLRFLIPLVFLRRRTQWPDNNAPTSHVEKRPSPNIHSEADDGLAAPPSSPEHGDALEEMMDFTGADEAPQIDPSLFRYSALFAGLVIPFAILLEIPGLTEHWYIKTEGNKVVDIRSNPTILDVGLGLSMASAVVANICLLARFMEWRVKLMTVVCVVFLSVHDIINIIAVTIFGIEHRFNDGYTYGQAFWVTVCSTVASLFTNISLVTDLVRTSAFAEKGSGLTRKQRSLIIVIMIFLIYVALASLVNAFVLNREFIEALYFTLVTILTVGFGDIFSVSTGGRVWTCAFAAVGIVILGVAVGMISDAVMEALELAYRKRVGNVRLMRREGEKRKKLQVRWLKAVGARLKEKRAPVWTADDGDPSGDHAPEGGRGARSRWSWMWRPRNTRRSGFRLNVRALSAHEREDAAREAGIPLSAITDVEGVGTPPQSGREEGTLALDKSFLHSYEDYNEGLESQKRKHFVAQFSSVWALFLIFWLVGSAIFMVTEGWTYGEAMYFCFIAFSTIGYGDFTIKTPAGRAIFVFWALLGVPAMTVLISVVVDAFSSRYKSALRTHAFDKAVKRYRKKKHLAHSRQQKQRQREQPHPRAASAPEPARSESQQRRRALAQLEALPHEILGHARELDERARYFSAAARAEPAGRTRDEEEGAAEGTALGLAAGLPLSLARLVEDVMEVGELAERVKGGMAQDAEMRQTLFMLSVEEALHEMIDAAERSLKVLAERDTATSSSSDMPSRE